MKRLFFTITLSIFAVIAVLTPLIWASETSVMQAKEGESGTTFVIEQNQIPAAAQPGKARVWVSHFAPFSNTLPGTAVTVTVNGTDVISNFLFGQTSDGYVPFDPGPTQIQIRLPDGTPAISETVTLASNTDYTVAAIGGTSASYAGLELYIVDGSDNNTPPNAGESKVRVVHLAPFGTTITETEVDILDENDNPVNGLVDVRYKDSSGYFSLAAGSYNLKISAAGGAITIPVPVTLADGEIVTVFAIGDKVLVGNQDVTVLPIVYNSARAYVAHLAPFSDMLASTSVTVSVNGVPALTNFEYGQTSGGYVNLTLGSNLVEVLLPNDAVAMSATLNLTPTDYTVAAIGNVVNQPPELFALIDDNSAPLSGQGKVRVVHVAPFSNTITGTLVDVLDDMNNEILTDFAYKENSGYLPLPAGTYNLKVTLPDSTAPVITVPTLSLGDGDIVSVFAIGDIINQPLDTLTIPEKTTIYLPIIRKS